MRLEDPAATSRLRKLPRRQPIEVGAEPIEVGAEPLEAGAEPIEAGAEPLEAGAEPIEAVAAAFTQEGARAGKAARTSPNHALADPTADRAGESRTSVGERKGEKEGEDASILLGRLVVQGGFAGEGVIPEEKQLPKFRGLRTCPSYNLNGDPKGALRVLASERIGRRLFVSKNVCHGVVYDGEMHEKVGQVKGRRKGLWLIHQGMETYLQKHPKGKIIHDPFAAACALEEEIAEWAEVEIYREKGAWGSRLASGSKTWIIVGYDHSKFLRVFLGDR